MMHPQFEAHVREVHGHYEAGDASLALRRLIDCAIETQQTAIFRQVLEFCAWEEDKNRKHTPEEVRAKAVDLLTQITNAGVKTTTPKSKILEVRGLEKQYIKSRFRITDLNFELSSGEIIGLVGENGNGKTTLLRLLAAELNPDRGEIDYTFVNGRKEDYDLKTRLVYIEQRIPRWYGTLMDNLQFMLTHYGVSGEDNLLWVEMMIARLGLRPFRHLSWNRISSGYRTRFELAKTLLRRPRILLLDEPLANLDIISQQTILQDLKFMAGSLSSPFGMILSSQHIYEVEKVSDKIIFLKNGAPQYQTSGKTMVEEVEAADPLIFEMEINCSREDLAAAFSSLSLSRVQYNGGVYVVHFSPGTQPSQVLQALSNARGELAYLRNISQSSRRFFINS